MNSMSAKIKRMTNLEKVLRKPFYAGLALTSGALVLGLYVYTQLLGIIENLDVWLALLQPLNAVLLIIFALAFGVTLAYQASLWFGPKSCSIQKRVGSTGVQGIGTLGLFLVAQCPACASIGLLLLPASIAGVVAQHSAVFTGISIALMVFTLHYLGAFKKE